MCVTKIKLIVKRNLQVKLLQHSVHIKPLILDPDLGSGMGEIWIRDTRSGIRDKHIGSYVQEISDNFWVKYPTSLSIIVADLDPEWKIQIQDL
jgi:hypothetical protein